MTDFNDFSHLQPPSDPAEFADWLAEQEERIAVKTRSALARIIGEPTKQFVDALTATGDMSYFDSIPMAWAAYVDDVLVPDLQGMFYAGGMKVYQESPNVLSLTDEATFVWADVVNQEAVAYAKESTNLMNDVGMTTWNTIKTSVAVKLETGVSIETLKNVIATNQKFSEYRADTIARTETLRAYNNGDWSGAKALGEFGPKRKFWIATFDPPRARPEHMAVSGTRLPMAVPFSVGGELMLYPHSPGASARNTVNCRCVLGYEY